MMPQGASLTACEAVSGFRLEPLFVPRNSSARPSLFRLDARVGRGVVAEVWRAAAPDDSSAALKFLKPEYAAHAAARDLLRREGRWLQELSHPSIVSSGGLVDGASVAMQPHPISEALVLEWLGGGDLVSLAGADPEHWIHAAIDVAAGLSYLHEYGLVHGDVKARNVLFDDAGKARLIDFSCALRLGTLLRRPHGTITQQRPRSDGHIVQVDDDVFAFAALLYELFTGRPPFAGDTSGSARPLRDLGAVSDDTRRGETLRSLRCGVMRVLMTDSPTGPPELPRLQVLLCAARDVIEDE
jgi:serine/threonine protein kinase